MSKKRDESLFITDISESTKAILFYVKDMELEDFVNDRKTYSAVIREFEIIGEATKHISDDLLLKYNDIIWRDLKDFRNLLIHEYFGVDYEIVWNTIHQDLAQLIDVTENMLNDIKSNSRG